MWTLVWHSLIQMIYEERHDSWIVFYSLCLCAAHIWRKAPLRPIIGGRTEEPVTRIYMTNEEGTAQQNPNKWIWETHTCMQSHKVKKKGASDRQAAVLTSKLARENLFVAVNEGTDLRTSWLIIYPAGFMALINFPPLSLFTFHWKSEVNLHLVLITTGSQQTLSLPSNPPTHTSSGRKEQLSHTLAG